MSTPNPKKHLDILVRLQSGAMEIAFIFPLEIVRLTIWSWSENLCLVEMYFALI